MAVSDISEIACTVTDTGITAPTYDVILEWFQNQYRSIYGSDIVLDNSTQDGQWIAIQAQAMNVCNQAMITVFNSFSPAKAQGAALSSNVKINGISREPATNSTCDVVISGDVGTVITNGTVLDTVNRNTWNLPESVTIPEGGLATVTAICATPGPISADIGTLTIIGTPTDGWTGVTNATVAAIGQPMQTDDSLRMQQARSTMLPSVSIMDGIVGGILALPGVSIVKGYENDTAVTDDNGIPAHSIAMIVEGGDAMQIATVIANKKSMGVPTYGTTTETVTDSSGTQRTINFFRPTETNIYVKLTVKPLANYNSTTVQEAAQGIADYIATQDIGSTIYIARLYKAATLADADGGMTYDILNIEIGRTADSVAASNLQLAFNERPVSSVSNVTVSVT